LKTISPNAFILYEDHSSDEHKTVNTTIKNIRVSGDVATADSYYKSQKKGTIYFLKEKGQWKLNLLADFARLELMLDELSKQKNMPVSEVIVFALESIYHKKVSPNIWDPIQ
jgi:hypothetical protein